MPRMSAMVTSTILFGLLGATFFAAAQPGPYAVWSITTSVRVTGPALYGDVVYAMPFEYAEEGTLPFELAAWNTSTQSQLFTVPLSSSNDPTQDWKGMTPAVTETTISGRKRRVVAYAFHQGVNLLGVDAINGAPLWSTPMSPPGCGIMDCEITGVSAAPGGDFFIVEQPMYLSRIDAATGHVTWNVSLTDNDGNPGSIRSRVAYDGTEAVIWSTRDHVHRVSTSNGGFLFSAQVTLPNCFAPMDGCVLTDFTPPRVVGEYIIVGGNADFESGAKGPGAIVALWKRTGTIVWTQAPCHIIWSVAADASIAVADPGQWDEGTTPPNASFAVFDLTTGKHLWGLNSSVTYFTDVAISRSGGYVAVSAINSDDEDQTMTLYHPSSGAAVGTLSTSFNSQLGFAVDHTGDVLVGSLSRSQGSTYGLTAVYIGNGSD